jgi:mono/diheme cytochrome c family protein
MHSFRWRRLSLALISFVACGRGDPGRTRIEPAASARIERALSPQDMYRQCFGNDPPPQGPLAESARMDAGFHVFAHTCVTCHQPSGRGMPSAFPPLAGSDFLMSDKARSIDIVLRGLTGAITVDGKPYAATMPSHAFLTDDDVANVLTFVRNTWGNEGEPVARGEVAARRVLDAAPIEIAPTP